MCGRYALHADRQTLVSAFELSECPEVTPRYNIAPMQPSLVVRQRPTGERVAHFLRWGLVPSWAKDTSIAPKLINARSETLAEKPSFRSAYKRRRCIVPASGFYEWKTEGKEKQPYYVHPASTELIGFAGLWERWTLPDADPLDTFTIVTTEANTAMTDIHERMPVILAPEDYGLWLSGETEQDLVHQLLVPCPADWIAKYPVGKDVGNVRNQGPDLLTPAIA
ncbi:SOS response-associated peptidase [Oryzomicrobium terrae]|uniref:SOS response-associated peptidase n=1 Tax=Oryzomicrobium terrae TaxID=1735038 RepID=UPI0011F04808|nr:SOS response-associated peptidase [Oryzomicrobium terrae]